MWDNTVWHCSTNVWGKISCNLLVYCRQIATKMCTALAHAYSLWNGDQNLGRHFTVASRGHVQHKSNCQIVWKQTSNSDQNVEFLHSTAESRTDALRWPAGRQSGSRNSSHYNHINSIQMRIVTALAQSCVLANWFRAFALGAYKSESRECTLHTIT